MRTLNELAELVEQRIHKSLTVEEFYEVGIKDNRVYLVVVRRGFDGQTMEQRLRWLNQNLKVPEEDQERVIVLLMAPSEIDTPVTQSYNWWEHLQHAWMFLTTPLEYMGR